MTLPNSLTSRMLGANGTVGAASFSIVLAALAAVLQGR